MPSRIVRNLRLFYAFRLLATSYLFVPIFMLVQADRGLSFFDRLALGGIYSAVIIIVEVPTGVFADLVGRRRSMIGGALAMVASCLLAARADGFAEFAVAESLAALSMALCSGADSAYLYDLLAAHDRTAEYPRRESTASAWHLLGCALAFAGGGLLAEIQLALPYLVTAGVAAAAAVIAVLLDEDPRVATQRAGRSAIRRSAIRLSVVRRSAIRSSAVRTWWNATVGAIAEVARNGRLAWLVGYSAVVFALLRATIYVYQPYLAERGLGLVAIGLLFAGVYLVASFVAFYTHQLRAWLGDDRLLWGLLGVLAASFVGLASAGSGPWMLGLLLVQAVANGVYSPLTKPLLNREIADSRSRAAVLSVESMARRAAIGLFAPLVGLYGQTDVMLLCGLVGLGGLVVLAVAHVRMRMVLDRADVGEQI
ncbi:MAG: MFS transporter [Deltaproteobacteria bacterium]|nr:MFS transporter [Deltaproteobacteria bacterium]MDQ3300262.1 MFS transporter [Myxococcota bacterium]